MSRDARRARRSKPKPSPAVDRRTPTRSIRDLVSGERVRDLIGLAVLATLLYANSFGVGLIVDSELVVAKDPRLRALTSENLRSILTQDYMAARGIVSGVYRPVTTLSYLVNYTVFGNGTNPAGYHLVNLLLHIANAALVYLLARILLRSRVPALCIAALFTAHPIATEAVTNVVGRADLLSALAVLGGTLLYIGSVDADGRAKRRWLIGLGVATALGLLAKENAIALVGVVLVYDVAFRGATSAPPLRERVRTGYAAVAAALVAVGLIRWRVYANAVVQRPSFVDNPLVGVDFWTARLTALKVIGRSIALLVWPRTLSWDYSYDQIALVHWPLVGWEDWQAPLALVGLIAAVGVAVWSARRQPVLCFFVAFALLTILPTANLIVPIGTIMAERFLYLPVVGFAGCVVLGLGALGARLRPPAASVLMPAVVALLVVVYGARTIARNGDWTDEVQLAQSAIDAAPRSAKVYLAYASALGHRDGADADLETMIAHVEQALAIMDDAPLAIELQESNIPLLLGIFYKSKGTQLARRGQDAQEWYRRAETMLDRAAAIQAAQNDEYHRAAARQGIPEDQVGEMGSHELPYHLGDLHMLLGEPAKAAADFATLRRRAPLSPQTHVSIAKAAMATGDLERAVESLAIAMTLGQRDQEVQRLLVDAYRKLDPNGCAVRQHADRVDVDGKCPIVRTHFCAAYVQMMELGIEARQWRLARAVGEATIKTGDCDRKPFDELLNRVAAEGR